MDYSNDALWVALPSRENEAADTLPSGMSRMNLDIAVFFIYPTADVTGPPGNSTLAKEQADTTVTDDFMRSMASAFTVCCSVFAPFYREATFESFLVSDPKAGDVAIAYAYRDVSDAFTSFLSRIGDDQDFVIAGHSQGSNHAYRLIQEQVIGTAVEKNFVAGYLPGMPIPQDAEIPVCASDTDTACVLVWNLFLDGADPTQTMRKIPLWIGGAMNRDDHSPFACNPPKPDTKDGYTAYSPKFGTTVIASTGACTPDGVWKIAKPKETWLSAEQVAPGWLHVYEIPITWFAISLDMKRRYDAWESKR